MLYRGQAKLAGWLAGWHLEDVYPKSTVALRLIRNKDKYLHCLHRHAGEPAHL